jgi:hypothetical protein
MLRHLAAGDPVECFVRPAVRKREHCGSDPGVIRVSTMITWRLILMLFNEMAPG